MSDQIGLYEWLSQSWITQFQAKKLRDQMRRQSPKPRKWKHYEMQGAVTSLRETLG